MASYDNAAAGARLRALIRERWAGKDWEFAERVGIDPVTLSRLVNGKSDLRRSSSLPAIAAALGVGEDEILYARSQEYPEEMVGQPLVPGAPADYGEPFGAVNPSGESEHSADVRTRVGPMLEALRRQAEIRRFVGQLGLGGAVGIARDMAELHRFSRDELLEVLKDVHDWANKADAEYERLFEELRRVRGTDSEPGGS